MSPFLDQERSLNFYNSWLSAFHCLQQVIVLSIMCTATILLIPKSGVFNGIWQTPNLMAILFNVKKLLDIPLPLQHGIWQMTLTYFKMFLEECTLVVAQSSDAVVTLGKLFCSTNKRAHLLLVPACVNLNSSLCCSWICSWCLSYFVPEDLASIWLLFWITITSNQQPRHCFSTYCSTEGAESHLGQTFQPQRPKGSTLKTLEKGKQCSLTIFHEFC